MDALSALDRARAALLAEQEVVTERPFASIIRGGRSQVALTGEAVHAVQGVAKTNAAESFCKRRDLQKTYKGTFSMRGEDEARTLVRCWVHRMTFFYEKEKSLVWGLGGDFGPADVASYVEPAELQRLAECASEALMQRIRIIRLIPSPNKK